MAARLHEDLSPVLRGSSQLPLAARASARAGKEEQPAARPAGLDQQRDRVRIASGVRRIDAERTARPAAAARAIDVRELVLSSEQLMLPRGEVLDDAVAGHLPPERRYVEVVDEMPGARGQLLRGPVIAHGRLRSAARGIRPSRGAGLPDGRRNDSLGMTSSFGVVAGCTPRTLCQLARGT